LQNRFLRSNSAPVRTVFRGESDLRQAAGEEPVSRRSKYPSPSSTQVNSHRSDGWRCTLRSRTRPQSVFPRSDRAAVQHGPSSARMFRTAAGDDRYAYGLISMLQALALANGRPDRTKNFRAEKKFFGGDSPLDPTGNDCPGPVPRVCTRPERKKLDKSSDLC